jgi:Na+-driven multidrug efflux pump
MFVLFPAGNEVLGAAAATLLSASASCVYLLIAFRRASGPLSMRVRDCRRISAASMRSLFAVGVPAALLTGLFDLANICVNMLSAAHDDLVLAGMGIVMKVERIPNAVNVGICQGMMPIVAYNYASGNRSRMRETIRTARLAGYAVSFASILLFELFAEPMTGLFMNTSAGNAAAAVQTLAHAAFFLRIRCAASPLQLTNYHSSYCMQSMGAGKYTLLHAAIRELVFYIPFQFILDRVFGITGLAFSLIAGEGCGALAAIGLLRRTIRKAESAKSGERRRDM